MWTHEAVDVFAWATLVLERVELSDQEFEFVTVVVAAFVLSLLSNGVSLNILGLLRML